jgi:hypothetical protein
MKQIPLLVLVTALAAGSAFAQPTSSPVPSLKDIEAEGDSGPSTKHGVNKAPDQRTTADRNGEPTTTGSGLRDKPNDTPANKQPTQDNAADNDTTPSGLTRD